MSKKILLADDEKRLTEAVSQILKYNGYNVDIASNGKEVLEKVLEGNYDIIILDIMMPIMNGIETIKAIRKNNITILIILVTAKSEIDDKVKGLDVGANDYITKPFNKKELLARIRVLTRKKENKKTIYKIGNIIFDTNNSQISTSKASLFLNNTECEIMKIFANNLNIVYSENEIKSKMEINEDNNVIPLYMNFLQEKFDILDANIKINQNNGYKLEKE